jgi:hypothetical protein
MSVTTQYTRHLLQPYSDFIFMQYEKYIGAICPREEVRKYNI